MTALKKFTASLCLFTLFCFQHLYAQNFEPATITTVDGKSSEGEINFQNWKRNPSKISFRSNKGAPIQKLGVADLQSFSVAGENYVAAAVEIDERTDNLSKLTYESNIVTHTSTVFLRTLISGGKSLYHLYDGEDHFYIKHNDAYELLRYKKFFSDVIDPTLAERGLPTGKHVSMNRDFAVRLGEYLDNCKAVEQTLGKTKYEERSLRLLFNNYYKCSPTDAKFVQAEEKTKFEFGVLAGATHTTVRFSSSTVNNILERTNFSASTQPTGGLFFNFVFPRDRGRTSLNNELTYSSYETDGVFRTQTTPTRYEEDRYHFAYTYIKYNVLLRYGMFAGNTTIFINGGVSNGFAISEEKSRVQFRKIDATEITHDGPILQRTRKYELGLLGGLGVKKNRLSLEFRVERSSGSFFDDQAKAHVMRYSGLLGYRIR